MSLCCLLNVLKAKGKSLFTLMLLNILRAKRLVMVCSMLLNIRPVIVILLLSGQNKQLSPLLLNVFRARLVIVFSAPTERDWFVIVFSCLYLTDIKGVHNVMQPSFQPNLSVYL